MTGRPVEEGAAWRAEPAVSATLAHGLTQKSELSESEYVGETAEVPAGNTSEYKLGEKTYAVTFDANGGYTIAGESGTTVTVGETVYSFSTSAAGAIAVSTFGTSAKVSGVLLGTSGGAEDITAELGTSSTAASDGTLEFTFGAGTAELRYDASGLKSASLNGTALTLSGTTAAGNDEYTIALKTDALEDGKLEVGEISVTSGFTTSVANSEEGLGDGIEAAGNVASQLLVYQYDSNNAYAMYVTYSASNQVSIITNPGTAEIDGQKVTFGADDYVMHGVISYDASGKKSVTWEKSGVVSDGASHSFDTELTGHVNIGLETGNDNTGATSHKFTFTPAQAQKYTGEILINTQATAAVKATNTIKFTNNTDKGAKDGNNNVAHSTTGSYAFEWEVGTTKGLPNSETPDSYKVELSNVRSFESAVDNATGKNTEDGEGKLSEGAWYGTITISFKMGDGKTGTYTFDNVNLTAPAKGGNTKDGGEGGVYASTGNQALLTFNKAEGWLLNTAGNKTADDNIRINILTTSTKNSIGIQKVTDDETVALETGKIAGVESAALLTFSGDADDNVLTFLDPTTWGGKGDGSAVDNEKLEAQTAEEVSEEFEKESVSTEKITGPGKDAAATSVKVEFGNQRVDLDVLNKALGTNFVEFPKTDGGRATSLQTFLNPDSDVTDENGIAQNQMILSIKLGGETFYVLTNKGYDNLEKAADGTVAKDLAKAKLYYGGDSIICDKGSLKDIKAGTLIKTTADNKAVAANEGVSGIILTKADGAQVLNLVAIADGKANTALTVERDEDETDGTFGDTLTYTAGAATNTVIEVNGAGEITKLYSVLANTTAGYVADPDTDITAGGTNAKNTYKAARLENESTSYDSMGANESYTGTIAFTSAASFALTDSDGTVVDALYASYTFSTASDHEFTITSIATSTAALGSSTTAGKFSVGEDDNAKDAKAYIVSGETTYTLEAKNFTDITVTGANIAVAASTIQQTTASEAVAGGTTYTYGTGANALSYTLDTAAVTGGLTTSVVAGESTYNITINEAGTGIEKVTLGTDAGTEEYAFSDSNLGLSFTIGSSADGLAITEATAVGDAFSGTGLTVSGGTATWTDTANNVAYTATFSDEGTAGVVDAADSVSILGTAIQGEAQEITFGSGRESVAAHYEGTLTLGSSKYTVITSSTETGAANTLTFQLDGSSDTLSAVAGYTVEFYDNDSIAGNGTEEFRWYANGAIEATGTTGAATLTGTIGKYSAVNVGDSFTIEGAGTPNLYTAEDGTTVQLGSDGKFTVKTGTGGEQITISGSEAEITRRIDGVSVAGQALQIVESGTGSSFSLVTITGGDAVLSADKKTLTLGGVDYAINTAASNYTLTADASSLGQQTDITKIPTTYSFSANGTDYTVAVNGTGSDTGVYSWVNGAYGDAVNDIVVSGDVTYTFNYAAGSASVTSAINGTTYTTSAALTAQEQSYIVVNGQEVYIDDFTNNTYATQYGGTRYTYNYNEDTGAVTITTSSPAAIYTLASDDEGEVATIQVNGEIVDASAVYEASWVADGATYTTVGTSAEIIAAIGDQASADDFSLNLTTVETSTTEVAGRAGTTFVSAEGSSTTAAIVDDSATLDGVTLTFEADGTGTYTTATTADGRTATIANGSFTIEGLEDDVLATLNEDGVWEIANGIDNITNNTDAAIKIKTANGDEGTLAAGATYSPESGLTDAGEGSIIKTENGYVTSDGEVTGAGEAAYEDGRLVISGADSTTKLNDAALPVSGDDDFDATVTGGVVSAVSGVSDKATVNGSGLEVEAEPNAEITLLGTGTNTVNGSVITQNGDEDGIQAKIDNEGALESIGGVSDGAVVIAPDGVPVGTDAIEGSFSADIDGNQVTLRGSDADGVVVEGDELSDVGNNVTVGASEPVNIVPESGTATVGLADGFNGSVAGSAVAVENDADGVRASVANGELTGVSDVDSGASVTVPEGTPVSTDGSGTFTVNDTPFTLENDADGITITPTEDGYQISGVSAGAILSSSEEVPVTVGSGLNTISGSIGPESSVKGAAAGSKPTTYDSNDQAVDDLIAELGTAYSNLPTLNASDSLDNNGVADFSGQPKSIIRDDTDGAARIVAPTVGGSLLQVDKDADGAKELVASNRGDVLVNRSEEAEVTLTGGAGADLIKTADEDDVVDVSAGGKDTLDVLENGADIRGYDPTASEAPAILTNAGTQDELLNAVKAGNPELKENGVNDNVTIEDLNANDDRTLAKFLSEDGEDQLYAWTGESGGELDASDLDEAAVLVGNATGDHAGSSINGANSNADTIVAGSGDVVKAGDKDTVELSHNGNEGAALEANTADSADITVNGFAGGFQDTADEIRSNANGFTFQRKSGVLELIFGAVKMALTGKNSAAFMEKAEDEVETTATEDGTATTTNAAIDTTDPASGVLEVKGADLNGENEAKYVLISEGKEYNVPGTSDSHEDFNFVGEGSTTSISPANNTSVNFNDVTGDVRVDLSGNVLTDSYNFKNIQNIKGGAGNSTIVGADGGKNGLYAGSGNSSILSGAGADSLYSYDGEGESKESTFFYTAGSGADSIKSFDWGSAENNDKIDFSSTALEEAAFDGKNLKITVEGGNDILTIENAKNQKIKATAAAMGFDGVVEFGDDLSYDKDVNMYGNVGEENNKLSITDADANGEAVAVYMNNKDEYGLAYDENYYYNVNTIDANGLSSNASLAGADGEDDSIRGGSGANSLWGGLGGDDTLVGGSGNNTFFYLNGDGNDVIENAKSGDTVELWNISIDDIDLAGTYNASDTGSIEVKFNNGTSLRVEGTDLGNVGFKVGDDTWKINSDKTWRNKGNDESDS